MSRLHKHNPESRSCHAARHEKIQEMSHASLLSAVPKLKISIRNSFCTIVMPKLKTTAAVL